jgi:putative hemolysin
MSSLAFETLLILLLILVNGVLAMSEMAIVSARRARLQPLAEDGEMGARIALSLADSPTQFLSTVQIGITLIGVLTGAVGGATLVEELTSWLGKAPWLAAYAESIALILVVGAITFVSLVVGELAPKRLALFYAERIATLTAPAMALLARVTSPLVRLLTVSTDSLLQLFGVQKLDEPPVTDAEVRHLLEQGAEVGVFEPIEEEIVGQIFRLSDRTVSALITPRTDIVWLDLNASQEEIRSKLIEHRYSQFPIADGDLDAVIGVIFAKDILVQSLLGREIDLHAVMRQPLFIPESTPALEVVERLRVSGMHIALVIDEYGGLEGMITMDDILAALIGDLPDLDAQPRNEAMQRDDGSWLIDGMYAIDRFKEQFEIDKLPDEEEGYYQTLGGFMMRMLEKIPAAGDHFEWAGLHLEVVDMDGRRVDKVLVQKKTD